jgi:acetyl-CoA C-acetyltransferase
MVLGYRKARCGSATKRHRLTVTLKQVGVVCKGRKDSNRRMTLPVAAIVGAAQVLQRPGSVDITEACGPVELMAQAASEAARDAGVASLLRRVGWLGVAGGWFRYRNPGQLVASMIGCRDTRTAISSVSGTGPQEMLAVAAQRISRGELDVALVVGGEARWSHQRLKRSGVEPGWTTALGEGEPEKLGGFPEEMIQETVAVGPPAHGYALIEDSLRSSIGETVDEHRDRIANLWARFSAIAARNPCSWQAGALSPSEIREPSPDNRMIAFPYTKAMVANNTVDMASALLVCNVDVALSAGVPADRMVFPLVVASAHETWKLANRDVLHRCPSLEAAATAAFRHAGVTPEQINHVDLYYCFPSIVEISSAAIGLSEESDLTLTGGLGFAGAPVGNAVGHSLAAMVGAVRSGGYGLVHANGGVATKHSVGVFSDSPSATFDYVDCQDLAALRPRQELPADYAGPVTVEAATVVFDRQGPAYLVCSVIGADAARGWARTSEPGAMNQAMSEGVAGVQGQRHGDTTLSL